MELNYEGKHDVLTKVETQYQNLRDAMTFTNFLLESIKKTKPRLTHEALQRASLIQKNNQLQGKVDRLTADVKYDKELIRVLQNGTVKSEE